MVFSRIPGIRSSNHSGEDSKKELATVPYAPSVARASLVRTSCSDIAVYFRSNKNCLIPCIKFENHSSEGRFWRSYRTGLEAVFEKDTFWDRISAGLWKGYEKIVCCDYIGEKSSLSFL